MIDLRPLKDDDPALAHSPMLRGVERTAGWIEANGGIPLTPSKAFKRVFVQWAAAEFDWPGCRPDDLYSVNKVLNEPDFPPLALLHQLMIELRLARHWKGRFELTRAGRNLASQRGRLFGVMTPTYLFEVDHAWVSRTGDQLPGNWDAYLNVLNVLNVEAENAATGGELRRALFGEPDPDEGFDETLSYLYVQVLRPFCWVGFLEEHRVEGYRLETRVFAKTPLWRAALGLSTDVHVRPATRH